MLVAVLLTYIGLFFVSPFIIWSSVWNVLWCALRAPVSARVKLRALGTLVKDLAPIPVHTALWYLDRVLFPPLSSGRHRVCLTAPVCILGSPRSGTTLLHRTIAMDAEHFFSATYLEWRWPYMSVWWLVDRLNLRQRVEHWSYWPKNDVGQLANKMHPHRWGNHEEHGIFLEEKFYRHYFLFRRYPFPGVLPAVADMESLTERQRQLMVESLLEVVQKIADYRGDGRVWLTKENESADFYRLLLERCPRAKIIYITRDDGKMHKSYDKLSVTSTRAKVGVDPSGICGWFRSNRLFRQVEGERARQLATELYQANDSRFVSTSYEQLVADIRGTVRSIYLKLDLPMSVAYYDRLDVMNVQQEKRQRGY